MKQGHPSLGEPRICIKSGQTVNLKTAKVREMQRVMPGTYPTIPPFWGAFQVSRFGPRKKKSQAGRPKKVLRLPPL